MRSSASLFENKPFHEAKLLDGRSWLSKEGLSKQFGRFGKHLRKNPLRALGLGLLASICLIALIAPQIAPYDPKEMGWPTFLHPSSEHWLGTDDMGRDIFSELIYGSRMSLAVGFLAATVAIIIGVSVGLIAGYYRGWVEEALMGMTDLFLLIPGLPLMIILAAYLGPSIYNIVMVISLLWWCSTARVVHARVLQVREMSFIESTKAMGFSDRYIIFRHVLLNTRDVVVAKWSLAITSAMIAEASLSFLGLSDPFQVSWGTMISNAFGRGGFAMDLWWWYLAPGLMICLTTSAFFLIAMGGRRSSYRMELI